MSKTTVVTLCENGKCEHLIKYCKCDISNKRCNIKHEYDYETKNWKVCCGEFKSVTCEICKNKSTCNLSK